MNMRTPDPQGYSTIEGLTYKTRTDGAVKVDSPNLDSLGVWIPLGALHTSSLLWLRDNNPIEGDEIELCIEHRCAVTKGLIEA